MASGASARLLANETTGLGQSWPFSTLLDCARLLHFLLGLAAPCGFLKQALGCTLWGPKSGRGKRRTLFNGVIHHHHQPIYTHCRAKASAGTSCLTGWIPLNLRLFDRHQPNCMGWPLSVGWRVRTARAENISRRHHPVIVFSNYLAELKKFALNLMSWLLCRGTLLSEAKLWYVASWTFCKNYRALITVSRATGGVVLPANCFWNLVSMKWAFWRAIFD